MGWRDVYKVHPAADVFPMLPEDELRKLGEDIKTHGLREPIIVWLDEDLPSSHPLYNQELLLDGRNRLAAMELVGILEHRERRTLWITQPWADPLWPQHVTLVGTGTDPYAYVISKNIHRRHLTKEQQAALIVAVMKAGTDFAKLARSVKRDSKGQVRGSVKDPVKEKAVKEGQKLGIGKRTMERAIAKDRGPVLKRKAEPKTVTYAKGGVTSAPSVALPAG